MASASYDNDFFQSHLQGSVDSARELVPLILQYIQPASVIDVGCGTGTWLSVWKEKGISDVLGVDGDYVNRKELLIAPEEFRPANLEKGFDAGRKFGLVTSLEVAEHIHPVHAETFIRSLCALSDVLVFSAAIPGQEGTSHLNEQFPSYWVDLFAKNGFSPYDILRAQVWDNTRISWWYRQNIMFFVKDGVKTQYPSITATPSKVLSMVHPDLFNYKLDKLANNEKALSNPFRAARYFAGRYFHAMKGALKRKK